VSVGAVVNMWAAGGWLVGPYRQNKSAAAESMAPMAFSAHRSHKSRAAWRAVHVEGFDAANAGSVGTRSSAGGLAVWHWVKARRSVGHTLRSRVESNCSRTERPLAVRRIVGRVSGAPLRFLSRVSRPWMRRAT